VRATVKNGAAYGKDFVKEVDVVVTEPVPVGDVFAASFYTEIALSEKWWTVPAYVKPGTAADHRLKFEIIEGGDKVSFANWMDVGWPTGIAAGSLPENSVACGLPSNPGEYMARLVFGPDLQVGDVLVVRVSSLANPSIQKTVSVKIATANVKTDPEPNPYI
jgi:hypothetical protein